MNLVLDCLSYLFAARVDEILYVYLEVNRSGDSFPGEIKWHNLWDRYISS